MAQNTVGSIPEFTSDEGAAVPEEVKQPVVEETAEEVKETPEPPAEKPDDTPIVEDTRELNPVGNVQELQKAVQGLQEERVQLRKEISELRGQRREIKQDQLARVEQQIDQLKDVNPDDVSVIEKVLRAKGYMTKEESSQMFYEAVKQEELNKFLDKFPEYKPENDPNDTNWAALQRELGFYRTPANPHQVYDLLERSHRAIVKVPSGQSVPIQAKQRQVQLAGAGSGGTQRPSPSGTPIDPDKKAMLRQGGFSEEEITNMEKRLNS